MQRFKILLFCLLWATGALAQGSLNKDSSELSYILPTKYEIGGIKVLGEQYDKNIITSLAGLSIGQKITIPGDDITDAIKNLWKQNLFSDIKINLDKIEDNKAYLSIYTKTRPKLSHYVITGVSNGKAKDLKDEIKLTPRTIVTEQLLANAKYNIHEYFVGKGYPNAKTTITQVPDSAFGRNSVKLNINIDKGKRVKINQILFTGNTQFTQRKLRHQLVKTKQRQWYNLIRASKFLPKEYEEDKTKLITFYQMNGYKDAKIVSDSVYKINENRINITINLSEGNKYYYRSINWTGNTKYDTKALNGILNIKKGDVYNPEVLESRLFINQAGLDVTSLYMDDGYLFFSVTPVETLVEYDSIDMEIRISEGPQATISTVKVTGNTKTHDKVILRELRTKPGQKFSRSDVIRSQRELTQLGYFNPEKMNVIPTPNPKDGTVSLEYIVEEKPSDQIELSGGYGANSLVGVLGLSLNNFSAANIFKPKEWQGYPSGDGERLSIRAQTTGRYYQSYNISFTEPWFGGKRPISFSVSPFISVLSNGLVSYDPSYYNLMIRGISTSLGKRLKWPDDFFTLTNTLSYQYFTFKNYQLIGNFRDGYANNLYFKHSLLRQGITQGTPIFPQGGSVISLSLQWTPPYSYFSPHTDFADENAQKKYKFIEYHKWKFDAAYYLGLGPRKKVVLMASCNYGFVGYYNSQIGLSPFERFYVGGDGLQGYSIDGRELIRLRGYSNYQAVTPNFVDGQTENGATIYDRYTFEVRVPFTTSQAATIYGLGFVEGGNAFLRFKQYDPFDIKRSAGVGLRLFLPMFGLLGVDWGYGFDSALPGGHAGSNFHLYIGQSLF